MSPRSRYTRLPTAKVPFIVPSIPRDTEPEGGHRGRFARPDLADCILHIVIENRLFFFSSPTEKKKNSLLPRQVRRRRRSRAIEGGRGLRGGKGGGEGSKRKNKSERAFSLYFFKRCDRVVEKRVPTRAMPEERTSVKGALLSGTGGFMPGERGPLEDGRGRDGGGQGGSLLT